MNFDQRKSEAKRLVAQFLQSYSPPRGLTPDQQAGRIVSVADAFARRMPTKGDYAEAVENVLTKIRDTHISNSWPPQGVFVMAMPQTEKVQPKAAETFKADEDEIAASRIEAGEPVAERYVWGSGAEKLLRDRRVTLDAIDRYRQGSIHTRRKTYGKHADEMLRRDFGAVVEPYLGGTQHAAE